MYVTYRDKLGYVLVVLDEHGISFLDGEAYFSDGIRDYRIPTNDLCEIQATKEVL